MTFGRIRARWEGASGLPGYNIFAAFDPALVTDPLRQFYQNNVINLPAGVTVTVEPTGDIVDEVNGQLVNSWTDATPPAVVNGSGSGKHAAGVGACVTWYTAGVVNGRRVRGRTFLVPLSTDAYETNGTILAAHLTQLNAAAQALLTATGPELRIWHRPVAGVGGSLHAVTGFRIQDKVAYLKSRRS